MGELSRRIKKENNERFKPHSNPVQGASESVGHAVGGLEAAEHPWYANGPLQEFSGSAGLEKAEAKLLHPAVEKVPQLASALKKSQLGNMHSTLMSNPTARDLQMAGLQHSLTGKAVDAVNGLGKGLATTKAGLGLLKLIDAPLTTYNYLASASNNLSDLHDRFRGYDPETHTQKTLDPAWANNPLNKHNFGLRLPMSPTIMGSVLKQVPALNPNGSRNILHNGDAIDETAEGLHGVANFVADKTRGFLNRYPMFGQRF